MRFSMTYFTSIGMELSTLLNLFPWAEHRRTKGGVKLHFIKSSELYA